MGSPRGSIWKHDTTMGTQVLLQTPAWFLALFLLALVGVLGLTWLAVGRWFRQAQQVRDAARSKWINGVSHGIRTPLSVVMGYAAQLEEETPDLAPEHKRQACAIRAQSQVIRDMVNNLLTNFVRHNDPGCAICLGARAEGKALVLWVEVETALGAVPPNSPPSLEPDGGAAYGTGLRLVAQIAAAHGGSAEFHSGIPYRCALRLPVKG